MHFVKWTSTNFWNWIAFYGFVNCYIQQWRRLSNRYCRSVSLSVCLSLSPCLRANKIPQILGWIWIKFYGATEYGFGSKWLHFDHLYTRGRKSLRGESPGGIFNGWVRSQSLTQNYQTCHDNPSSEVSFVGSTAPSRTQIHRVMRSLLSGMCTVPGAFPVLNNMNLRAISPPQRSFSFTWRSDVVACSKSLLTHLITYLLKPRPDSARTRT